MVIICSSGVFNSLDQRHFAMEAGDESVWPLDRAQWYIIFCLDCKNFWAGYAEVVEQLRKGCPQECVHLLEAPLKIELHRSCREGGHCKTSLHIHVNLVRRWKWRHHCFNSLEYVM